MSTKHLSFTAHLAAGEEIGPFAGIPTVLWGPNL